MRSRIEAGEFQAARDRSAVQRLANLLRNTDFSAAGAGVTCVARHLGAASLLLGEPEQARAHYERALRHKEVLKA